MTDITRAQQSSAGWSFDNSYARLPETLFTPANPTPAASPKLIVFNRRLAESLGLDASLLDSEQGAALFAGNDIPEGALPIAQAYAGHQFGHFNRLGDGRAILLGEQITPDGKRFDVQLKGSGRTPYSRSGDGKAAVGPMLREYIISEAMHALGIPTTRSLAVTATGDPVYRETLLPGAVLTRIAASHLRVGTFQFAAQWGAEGDVRTLADYALERHYSEAAANTEGNRYLRLLDEVVQRQAKLIGQWQLVGFIHGVMNTDNMSICGETIDYGPCAFMDTFDPATVFSSIDTQGRYAYGNQPQIGMWNLARFAEALLPLLHDNQEQAIKLAEKSLIRYMDLYQHHRLAGMRSKLGLFNEESEDETLINELLRLMHAHRADYTNTFRTLTLGERTESTAGMLASEEFANWYKQWQARLARQTESAAASQELMRSCNPAVIPRNHRVEEALEAAVQREDYTVMEKLLAALTNPYAYGEEQAEYASLTEPCAQPYRTFCGT